MFKFQIKPVLETCTHPVVVDLEEAEGLIAALGTRVEVHIYCVLPPQVHGQRLLLNNANLH